MTRAAGHTEFLGPVLPFDFSSGERYYGEQVYVHERTTDGDRIIGMIKFNEVFMDHGRRRYRAGEEGSRRRERDSLDPSFRDRKTYSAVKSDQSRAGGLESRAATGIRAPYRHGIGYTYVYVYVHSRL